MLGVEKFKLIPVELVEKITRHERTRLSQRYNFLRLEGFDHIDYDERSPEDWIDMGLLDDVRHPIPAIAFLPIAKQEIQLEKLTVELLTDLFEWINVAVTHYDPLHRLFSLLTLDGKQSTYKAPRIYIMFKAEDPARFAERIQQSVLLRDNVENRIR